MTQPIVNPLDGLPKGVSVSHTARLIGRQRDTIKESDMIFQETMWRMSVRRQTFVSEYRAQPPGCYPW